MLFNTLVHVFMYYYYFACTIPALRKSLWWKKYLTLLQILQFVTSLVFAGLLVKAHVALRQRGLEGCAGWNAFLVSTLFNVTLLALFVEFYLRSYKTSKGSGTSSEKKREAARGSEANGIKKAQ